MRSLWDSRKITWADHDRYTNRWVNLHFGDNEKHRSSAKSNINRALADEEMTLKTFMRGVSILPIRQIVITMQATWGDEIVTYHQVTASQANNFEGIDEIGGTKFNTNHRYGSIEDHQKSE